MPSTCSLRRLFLLLFSILSLSLSLSVHASQRTDGSEPLADSDTYKKIDLTEQEQSFLRAHPQILLGVSDDWSAYAIRHSSGKLIGFGADMLKHINATTGANIKLVAGPWKETVEKAEKREIDGLSISLPSEDRSESFLFSDSFLTAYPAFIVSADSPQNIEAINDLNGKTVAILAGHKFYQKLLSAYPEITVIERPSELDVVRSVVEGKASAAIVATISYDKFLKSFAGSIRLSYVATDHPLNLLYSIRKDWPQLVSIINKGLTSIPAETFNTSYYHWFGMEPPAIDAVPQPAFSADEQAWLAQKPLVRVHIGDYPPYYSSTRNNVQGICVDYLNLVAKRAGFKIAYVTNLSWLEALQGIRAHQNVDLLPAAYITGERKKYLNFTSEYLKSPSVIFARNNGPMINAMADLSGKTIAVEKGYATSNWLQEQFPDVKQLFKDTTAEALQSLASGEVDAFIGNLTISLYISRTNGLNNLKVVAPSPFVSDNSAMAVRNDWPELPTIIDKTLATLTPEEHEEIRSRWTPPIHYEQGFSLKDLIKWVGAVSAVLLAIIGMFTVWNRKLGAQITARKETEMLLRKSEEKFRVSFYTSPNSINLNRLDDGVYIEVNAGFTEIMGYSADEVIGLSSLDLKIWKNGKDREKLAEDLKKYGRVDNFEADFIAKNGDIKIGMMSAQIIEVDGEKLILSITRDVTERKFAEEKFGILVTEASIGIGLADAFSGELLECNPALAQMLEYTREEMIGKPQSIIHHGPGADSTLTENFVRNREAVSGSISHQTAVTKSGRVIDVEIKTTRFKIGNRDVVLGFFQDISERKRSEIERSALEIQLRQKYKMEAVGVMAGGMAHNFNNNLSIILGNLELCKMKRPEDSEIVGFLDNAKIAVFRSRDLIKQIMSYSRQNDEEKTSLNLLLLMDETVQLLRATIPTTINLQKEIAGNSQNLIIDAAPSQLQECLINLCNNAMQAMDETGDITISLQTEDLHQDDIPLHYDAKPGRYAKLSVTDTGAGMTKDVLDKIFDLFFTTKSVDEGTGVGLSTVQGIVKEHAGLIKVDSTPGAGTSFHLFFPLIEVEAEIESVSDNQEFLRGTEHILFVDDDEMLAKMGDLMLTEMGYQVSKMTESREALKLFAANADGFDLVITDQTMPGLTGKELIQELKQIRPEIPTIICTGFSSKIDEAEAKKLGADAFLMKPLDLSELLLTVRRVLGMENKEAATD